MKQRKKLRNELLGLLSFFNWIWLDCIVNRIQEVLFVSWKQKHKKRHQTSGECATNKSLSQQFVCFFLIFPLSSHWILTGGINDTHGFHFKIVKLYIIYCVWINILLMYWIFYAELIWNEFTVDLWYFVDFLLNASSNNCQLFEFKYIVVHHSNNLTKNTNELFPFLLFHSHKKNKIFQ